MQNRKGPSPWLTFTVGPALTVLWIYLNIRHWKDPNADYMAIAVNIVITASLWIGLAVATW